MITREVHPIPWTRLTTREMRGITVQMEVYEMYTIAMSMSIISTTRRTANTIWEVYIIPIGVTMSSYEMYSVQSTSHPSG